MVAIEALKMLEAKKRNLSSSLTLFTCLSLYPNPRNDSHGPVIAKVAGGPLPPPLGFPQWSAWSVQKASGLLERNGGFPKKTGFSVGFPEKGAR